MGKIVVGVDGSAGSRRALRWAYAEATLRSASLEVVTVWQYPVTTTLPAFGIMPTPDDLGAEARNALVGIIADEEIPTQGDVDVTLLVAEGTAAHAILDAAKDAELLVVGSRGHGGFTGLLLGSVSQQCVIHSKCPIVIVHPE